MQHNRIEGSYDDSRSDLCALCRLLQKGKSEGRYEAPLPLSSFPLCCSLHYPHSCLRDIGSLCNPNKLCPMKVPGRHVILWHSCSGYAVTDSMKPCGEFTSRYSASDQWDKFTNFATNFKDYQKVSPSFPGVGRFLLVALLMVTLPLTFAMSPPPNYSHANMPNTNFTCSDKATGGYYADPEAGCQMFHVCVRISDDEMNDFRFLCPNDTVFDQQNFICTNWWDIDCERSTRYYSKNDLFRVPGEQPAEYEYETPESPVYYEYVYEYGDGEGTTETVVEEDPFPGRHRLNLGKETNESPKGRSVETSILTTTENPRAFDPTTKGLPWRSSSSTVYATTSTPTSQTLSITSSSNKKRNFKPNSVQDTTVKPISITEPSSYFHFGSAIHSNASSDDPSNAFEIQRFNSRGGSPYQDKPEEQNLKTEGNETQKSELDSNDPFANFEWKKDSSSVTASARTRYETLFGETNRNGKVFAQKDDSNNTQASTKSPNEKVSSTTSPNARWKSISSPESKGQQQEQEDQKEKESQEPSSTKAKHKEFSNFRFYKTAFGRSYSSDDFLGKKGEKPPQIRISDPVRLQRTASRNTRYSVYG